MRGLLGMGQRAVPCILAAGCVLSLGRAVVAGGMGSGSCPCGRGGAPVAAAVPPPTQIPPGPNYLGPLPPVSPPPGTLGVTYARQSWPIPADRHPRIAMLDVRAPAGTSNVRVLTTYEYREEDEIPGFQDPNNPTVWHFESKPLLPGIPHIYRVVAENGSSQDAQYVRLIRGRRVTLEYPEVRQELD